MPQHSTSTALAPRPVTWTPEREARNSLTGRKRLARCSADRSCPWRWRQAPDRPCPWHQHESDWDDLEARARLAGIELRPGRTGP